MCKGNVAESGRKQMRNNNMASGRFTTDASYIWKQFTYIYMFTRISPWIQCPRVLLLASVNMII